VHSLLVCSVHLISLVPEAVEYVIECILQCALQFP